MEYIFYANFRHTIHQYHIIVMRFYAYFSGAMNEQQSVQDVMVRVKCLPDDNDIFDEIM